MGRGDVKSRAGKIRRSSFGKSRPRPAKMRAARRNKKTA